MPHFKTDDGKPALRWIRQLVEEGNGPTAGDLLFAGNNQRSRILERTGRGVDYQGNPFAGYSTKGPYYYTPFSGGAAGTPKQHKAAAGRFLKKIGGGTPAARSRTGRSVKFPSYDAFKRAIGRTGVDLRGPRAPHMLQAVVLLSGGIQVTGSQQASTAPRTRMQRETRLVMAIYGEEAARAEGHNEGTSRLPKRRFFDASDSDLDRMLEDVYNRMVARLSRS